jgi:hypothetical protein
MKNKFSIFKKVLSAIAVFTFIKLVLVLFINGYDDLGILDTILNMVFFSIIMIYILKGISKKANPNDNGQIVNRKRVSSPPRPDNKPLHPK